MFGHNRRTSKDIYKLTSSNKIEQKYNLTKVYDHIRRQLSVKVLSYFFVQKESIATTTFTQKYACEENDKKSVLEFCVRKENQQSLIIHNRSNFQVFPCCKYKHTKTSTTG